MNNWWVFYLLAVATAFALATALTPLFRALAWRLNILDKPLSEGHKMHSQATALLGGAAVCTSWVISIAIGIGVVHFKMFELPADFPGIFSAGNPALQRMVIIACCAVGFVILGFCDDRKPMSAKVKFFFQALFCFGTACGIF